MAIATKMCFAPPTQSLEIDMADALQRYEALESAVEASLVACDVCNTKCAPEDIEVLGDRHVCCNCAKSHLDAQFDHLGNAYIARSVSRYLSSGKCNDEADQGMFYNWWFTGLEKTERARILRAAYEEEKRTQSAGYYPTDEWEFCVRSDDWPDFVREQLDEKSSPPCSLVHNQPVA